MNFLQVDVGKNRAAQKWTYKEQAGRVLWAVTWPLFRFSPRPFWVWRRLILCVFGAKVAANVAVYPTVRITMPWNLSLGEGCALGDHAILYALGSITIGPRTTVSQYAHLCAGSHDWRDPAMPLVKAPIKIGSDCWICADAFLGPGVTIGSGSIVAARAVVVKDVPPEIVVAGNPAKRVGDALRSSPISTV